MRVRKRVSDDGGAALIIALLIVTTMALVIAGMLAFSDTSVRTTVKLRDQAAAAYAADGAAKIAIDALKKNGFNNDVGQKCFGSSNALPLSDIGYTASDGHTLSTSVVCDTDAQSGKSAPFHLKAPATAILTLGPAPSGLTVSVQGGRTTQVKGRIFSRSSITVNGILSDTNSSVYYTTTCTGTVMSSSTPPCTLATPATTSQYGQDPNYTLAAGSVAAGTIPTACVTGSGVAEFYPGLYTNGAALTNCKAKILHFNPAVGGGNGIYYFSFGSVAGNQWNPTQVIIGGTVTQPLNPNSLPTTDGNCYDPVQQAGHDGVEFVFGGQSQFNPTKSGSGNTALVEICGTRDPTNAQPPIAVYGLKSDIKDGLGNVVVPAQPIGTQLMTTTNGDKPAVFIRGTSYVPNAAMTLYVNNDSRQIFNFGVIARNLVLSVNPQSGGTYLIYTDDVDVASTDVPSDMLLRVSVDGKLRLIVRASIPQAAPRQVSVLSWAVQR
jgi:hypothetical protein